MADIAIQPVETRSQQQRFIRLPWRIYQDDPCWMPPLIMAQEELLGFRKHPFYERSKSQSFLITRGGRDVGRITAIVNAGHLDRYKEQRGFFGFFECDDDTAASRARVASTSAAEGAAVLLAATEAVEEVEASRPRTASPVRTPIAASSLSRACSAPPMRSSRSWVSRAASARATRSRAKAALAAALLSRNWSFALMR